MCIVTGLFYGNMRPIYTAKGLRKPELVFHFLKKPAISPSVVGNAIYLGPNSLAIKAHT